MENRQVKGKVVNRSRAGGGEVISIRAGGSRGPRAER